MAIISRGGLTLTLVLLCVIAICLDSAEAGRNRKGRRKQGGRDKSQCKYRTVKTKVCDPETNTKNLTLTLRRGNETKCPKTHVIALSCRKLEGCEYNGKAAKWTECDPITGRRVLVKQLEEGSPETCPSTHIKVRRCKKVGRSRGGDRRNKKARKQERKAARKEARKEARRERKMAKKGKKGKRSKTRKQRKMKKDKDCKYKRGRWLPCMDGSQVRQREMVRVSGDPVHCLPKKIVSRPCKLRERPTLHSGCETKLTDWQPCDARTNTTIRFQYTLGDSDKCKIAAKTETKECTVDCEYEVGNWSICNLDTQLATRTDTLVKGDPQCEATKLTTKKCKKVCKYTLDDWSECDPVTDKRSRVKRLTEGDPGTCEGEMTIARPCRNKHGVERCFYGNWGDFGPCTNGVSTKTRPLVQGGVECERKAVITRACERDRS